MKETHKIYHQLKKPFGSFIYNNSFLIDDKKILKIESYSKEYFELKNLFLELSLHGIGIKMFY